MIKDFFQESIEEAKEWTRGRYWHWRLILWGYMVYIFLYSLINPMYQSWFKPLNLGIHELGHVIFSPFGQFIMITGGTFLQCLIPLISFLMFYRQRDYFAISISFCWLATNFFDVAIYIADARKMELPMISPFRGDNIIHDWNYLLTQLGLLQMNIGIAFLIKMLAVFSMLTGLILGGWLLFRMKKKKGSSL